MDTLTMKDKFAVVRTLQENLFQRNGSEWLKVVTGSMHPVIQVNDRILVRKTPIEGLKSGDIVLYSADGQLIVHRIIKIVRESDRVMILQKGDANNQACIISSESIMGKVTAIQKNGKTVELESLRGRCINMLPAVMNSLFHKASRSRVWRRDERKLSPVFFHVYELLLRYAGRSLVLCSRVIVKILIRSH